MIRKVLVAEDLDSIQIGVMRTLGDAFTFDMEHAKYCDQAFLKIRKALMEDNSFDLLITDLSFPKDHVKTEIHSGEQLVAMVKGLQPGIKTIIYSIEDRPFKIREYLDYLEVDGYVLKGRSSSGELVEAVQTVADNGRYISPALAYALKNLPPLEVDDYDLELIRELGNGNSQQEIAVLFDKRGLSPSSLSSIEKRINKLKEYFMARNTTHLVAIAKDMGLF